MKAPKKVEIIYHFSIGDSTGGDYHDVTVNFDGKEVCEYGDYYHDKGGERAEAFIQGVAYALGGKFPKIKTKKVADRDW